ncbi:Imm50 family immunity protein [Nocardia sp. NPDC059177]|uniref:Imm50 family immunity protein n=1 Tax=Nocardia sp. NPDC059177 TaxID=3346759 RepID=UPI0036CB06D0
MSTSSSPGDMNWIELVENSDSLTKMYGGKVPSLLELNLHEIELHRDGPTLKLRFNLNSFPENPPIKWTMENCNTVQIELELRPVADATINGIHNISVVDIDISPVTLNDVDVIRVRTTGKSTSQIDAIGERIHLSKVSAYYIQNKPSEPDQHSPD